MPQLTSAATNLGANAGRVDAASHFRWLLLVALAVMVVLAGVPAYAAGGPLVGPPNASDQARFNRSPPSPGVAVVRQRPVTVDLESLDPSSGTPPTQISIELFDGQSVTVNLDRIEKRRAGNFTWRGKVQGYPRGSASFTVVGGEVSGIVDLGGVGKVPGGTYQIQSNRDGLKLLQQLDATAFPPDHPPGGGDPVAPVTTKSSAVNATGALSFDSAADAYSEKADSGAIIDVLVVYSNQTAAAAGTSIGAQIQQAVDTANTTYANSGITTRLRLVQAQQISYDESGDFTTDLNWLAASSTVATLRNTYGADLVSMFVENGQYCGMGWVGPNPNYAFTVVNRGCSSGNYSFPHEIGHNFGALHDTYVDSSTTPYPYGHGYVDCTEGWRDVMAYPTQCGGTRIPYFSNPNMTYGSPADPLGNTSTADNVRVHNSNAYTVANFRPTASGSSGTCSYALSSKNVSIAAAATTGSFAVTSATGCAWNASSTASWLTIASGSGTSATGTLFYAAAGNSGPMRSASINVGGVLFGVSQASGCTYSLSPGSASVTAAGGTGTTSLNTTPGCTWTATSSASWLTISSATGGTSGATVSYLAAVNTGAARSANLTIGGATYIVTQAAASSVSTSAPSVALKATSLSFGSVTLGTTSAAKSTTVTNSGGAALTITALTVGGANPSEFTRTGTCAVNAALAPGQRCTVIFTFGPRALGARTASLSIGTTAGNSTLTLSGTGRKAGK